MLAVLVKLCVEFDAQLDPRLCAREQLDAEPWHYLILVGPFSAWVSTDSDTFSNHWVVDVLTDALFEKERVVSDALWRPLSELQEMCQAKR